MSLALELEHELELAQEDLAEAQLDAEGWMRSYYEIDIELRHMRDQVFMALDALPRNDPNAEPIRRLRRLIARLDTRHKSLQSVDDVDHSTDNDVDDINHNVKNLH